MINFFILQNRAGKTRLSKYYNPIYNKDEIMKRDFESKLHKIVAQRDPKITSFFEFQNVRVIFRRYAGLYFIFGIDMNDNELIHFETIHLFVEVLDHYFSNVCELDLVFNFHKVYLILDEFICGGEVQETAKKVMLERLLELEKIKT
mmetsp:Transcript_19428/g.35072  ORF Transcript_19428/g.35072 Transcript_19428/m.35072 type:complete len:147 (-) Transcript_19428:568-1008(-)